MEKGKTKISYFRDCRTTRPEAANISASLYWIRTGSSKELIEEIRITKDPKRKDRLKRKLPAATFGGYFEDRSSLLEASGFACLDFDKVEHLNTLKEQLKASEYIYSCWLSPSGNGLKALVQIPVVSGKEEYTARYKAVLKHFKNLSPDEATKDINRLCFESYDPDLYLNESSTLFTEKVKPSKKEVPILRKTKDIPEGQIIDRIISWWVKKFPFAKGNRNNSLFVLACTLSNFGISQGTTEDLFCSFEDEDFNHSEIQKIISSAYKKAQFNSQSFSR